MALIVKALAPSERENHAPVTVGNDSSVSCQGWGILLTVAGAVSTLGALSLIGLGVGRIRRDFTSNPSLRTSTLAKLRKLFGRRTSKRSQSNLEIDLGENVRPSESQSLFRWVLRERQRDERAHESLDARVSKLAEDTTGGQRMVVALLAFGVLFQTAGAVVLARC